METNESSYLLKMVQQLKSVGKSEANGVQDEYEILVGVGEDHAMTFDIKDVSGLNVEGVDISSNEKLQNGKRSDQYPG